MTTPDSLQPRRLAALTLTTVLALAGCSSTPTAKQAQPASSAVTATPVASSPTPSPTPSGEPRTYDAAKAAVDKMDAAAKAGDGATEWDMLTAAGQATMTRDDYIKVVKSCPKLVASNPTLSIALDAGGSSATVKAAAPPEQGGQPYEWKLIYENGHWKHQPSDAAMSWMGLGADKALTMLRNGGYC